MASSHAINSMPPPGRLLSLPTEVLVQVIDHLVLDLMSHPALSKTTWTENDIDENDVRRHSRRRLALRHLCLSCRRLSSIATLHLYRSIPLFRSERVVRVAEPFQLPGTLPRLYFVVDAPVLLLRTLLENPGLRGLVEEMDCFVFLGSLPYPYIVEARTSPNQALRLPVDDPSGFGNSWARLSPTIARPLASAQDEHLLRYVGLVRRRDQQRPEDDDDDDDAWAWAVHGVPDVGERIMAAILCLTQRLQRLTVRPLPSWPQLPAEATQYKTLSALIWSAVEDPLLGPTTLRRLDLVRFATQGGIEASNELLDAFPSDYCIRADSCPGLVRPPSVAEVTTTQDDGGWEGLVAAAGPGVRRVYIATASPNKALAAIGAAGGAAAHWQLSELKVGKTNVGTGRRGGHSTDPRVCDAALARYAGSLRYLNLAYLGDPIGLSPCRPLESLASFTQLEDLFITSPLLVAAGDRSSSSSSGVAPRLRDILPASLVFLFVTECQATYSDFWSADVDEEDQDEEEEDDSGGSARPDAGGGPPKYPRHRTILPEALRAFAPVCSTTHPRLKFVTVESELLPGMDRDPQVPLFSHIFVHGAELREMFEAAGVSFVALDIEDW